MKPILKRFDEEEQLKRKDYYQRLIDFVNRRDLNRSYAKWYQKKSREVWQFINQVNFYELDNGKDKDDDDDEDYFDTVS